MIEKLIVDSLAPFISKIPTVDLSGVFNQPGVSTFMDYLDVVSYFLPWNTVCDVVAILISIYAIRIFVAFFKMLWGILPVA